jgi:hypothetical protein
MNQYLVWSNDYGHEEDGADTISAHDEQQAAEAWVEEMFLDLSYPTDIDVNVREASAAKGTDTLWHVSVESIPVFHAALKARGG